MGFGSRSIDSSSCTTIPSVKCNVDGEPARNTRVAVLGVLPAVHHLVALNTRARAFAAALTGTEFAHEVHHAFLGVLLAVQSPRYRACHTSPSWYSRRGHKTCLRRSLCNSRRASRSRQPPCRLLHQNSPLCCSSRGKNQTSTTHFSLRQRSTPSLRSPRLPRHAACSARPPCFPQHRSLAICCSPPAHKVSCDVNHTLRGMLPGVTATLLPSRPNLGDFPQPSWAQHLLARSPCLPRLAACSTRPPCCPAHERFAASRTLPGQNTSPSGTPCRPPRIACSMRQPNYPPHQR